MLAQLKKHLTLHELWEDAKFFFLLNLGLVATAVGIAVFKTPNHFAFGGTSGLSIVLATLFPRWNVGAFMWFINAALVVLGFVFLGVRSMGWTIYSSFALSFYVSLCERVCPPFRAADERCVSGALLRGHSVRRRRGHRVQHRRVHGRNRYCGDDPEQVHKHARWPRADGQ